MLRSSASHTAPLPSASIAKDQGLGRRACSSAKPGSSVAAVPSVIGTPVPTRYTPAKSVSSNDAYNWPATTATDRASPVQTPALVVTGVSVAAPPHT